MLVAAAASAAELVASELEGDVNAVTVEQGGSTSFVVSFKATGLVRCLATPANPATATVPDGWWIPATGSPVPGSGARVLAFWGGTPINDGCQVTWDGDPTWLTATLSVSAAHDAPLGNHMIRLRPTLFTPPGSGPTLRDDTATFLTFTVVEGSDNAPPVVDCAGPAGTQGNGGWWLSDVRFDCTAHDDGIGLASSDDASFTLTTDGEGSVSTSSRDVSDDAGNTTTAGPYGPFDVDLTDPLVDLWAPADGATYTLGQSAHAAYGCDDAGSGLASCEGSVAPGGALDTGTVGDKTVTVTATDVAGRATSVSHTYRVVYAFGGLDAASGRDLRAGSAIPLRWSLGGVSDLGSLVSATSVPCDGGDPVSAATPGSSALTYHEGAGEFSLVWKTEKSWRGCRELRLALADGSVHTATFSFR